MGLLSGEPSEDDTSYTDCNSHISSCSPHVERRGEEEEEEERAHPHGSRKNEGGGRSKNLNLSPLHSDLGKIFYHDTIICFKVYQHRLPIMKLGFKT